MLSLFLYGDGAILSRVFIAQSVIIKRNKVGPNSCPSLSMGLDQKPSLPIVNATGHKKLDRTKFATLKWLYRKTIHPKVSVVID